MKFKSLLLLLSLFIFSCKTDNGSVATNENKINSSTSSTEKDDFQWQTESFADLGILRYKVNGFDKLNLDQKKLVYYLTQAGLAGRDIMYDQNYRHNLEIRKALEKVIKNYQGKQKGEEWVALMEYAKRMWFSNGIHHHYSNDKFEPAFSRNYLGSLMKETGATISAEGLEAIFNPDFDNKKVNRDASKGIVKGSAVNFYDPDITEAEVDAFYAKKMDKGNDKPISYGLNSKLVRNADGTLSEKVYSANGMYGPAIKEIMSWLEQAVGVAENEPQKEALKLLIKYYETGDLKIWDDYNIAWVKATEGDVDYINGFIEVYNDPKGYRGSYETIVQINDFDASARMAVVAENAQWFEDNSSIMDKHKKKEVKGVSYKVVTVAGESGDASPSTPIGVNLPNANWIRSNHGSKSVSLGNITEAYNNASGPGMLNEFSHDDKEISLAKKYGKLAGKMHTALHEVIGHASGQIEPGVGTPKETIKNYASSLEEARADLVSLYYIRNKKLIDFGLMESTDVGNAAYDNYIKNGMMLQLRRLKLGDNVEQSHMRNRQMVARWAYEKGKKDNVIEIVKKDGKSYIEIHDYDKLNELFGELLKEVQRVKSQGDFAGAKALIEGYGVQVDQALHKEVLDRVKELNLPAYWGFINPEYEVVENEDGEVTDIKVNYPKDFVNQMMMYADKYGYL